MCDIMIAHLQGRIIQQPIESLRNIMVNLDMNIQGRFSVQLEEIWSLYSNGNFDYDRAGELLHSLQQDWMNRGDALAAILNVEQTDMVTNIIQHIVDAAFHLPVEPGNQETFASHVFLADRTACELYHDIMN